MKKTLVIGAGGKVSQLLFSRYLESLGPVVAMVRDRRKLSLPESVNIIEADLEKNIEFAMEGCHRVVFTAGSGAGTGLDKTLLVDLWGACKAIDAAKNQSIEHFVMVSARGADNPDKGPQAIKPYLVAKHFADEYLIQSGLNYTILRPGRLTDDDGTEWITTSRPSDPEMQTISRAVTAKVIAHCLNSNLVNNKVYELYSGSDSIESVIL